MDSGEQLFALLSAGAKLAASGAAGEFAKTGGKAVFEKLKGRLTTAHKVKSLDLLERARDEPDLAAEIKAELAEIGADTELAYLAKTLRAAIASLPESTTQACAIDIDTIRAGGNLTFRNVQGVTSTLAEGKGDLIFEDIQAPPGKAKAAGLLKPDPRRR